jgi:N-acetylmuramoyl-L-alanine amidase
MKILSHKLCDDDGQPTGFHRSPNQSGEISPEFLVIHYTAGTNSQGSVDWLCQPRAQASAHLVIGRDGQVVQLVAFNRKAWHAGTSQWDGRRGVNAFSIGIELDNAGRLDGKEGQWVSWQGVAIPDEEVVERAHPGDGVTSGWHTYSALQLAAVSEISSLLVEKYGLRDVIGHEDVSPGRKVDPGPSFPMRSFRSAVMGRADDQGDLFETTAALNIRVGPGTAHSRLPASPLPLGTAVEVLATKGIWRQVDVLDPIEGENDVVGWVHGRYLKMG